MLPDVFGKCSTVVLDVDTGQPDKQQSGHRMAGGPASWPKVLKEKEAIHAAREIAELLNQFNIEPKNMLFYNSNR